MNSIIGYAWLKEYYQLKLVPHYLCSYAGKIPGTKAPHVARHNIEYRAFDARLDPGDDPLSHLLFALRHEGPNPHYLSQLFQQADLQENILEHIKNSPSGIWPRRLWFWYEWLTGETLPLDDCPTTGYKEVIDSRMYYVVQAKNIRRYCLRNNVPGIPAMVPLVRRNKVIDKVSDDKLVLAIEKELDQFDRQLIERAARYLISSEIKSSSEIEGEKLNADKQLRFSQAVEKAGNDKLDLDTLIKIQAVVRDPRYAEITFRTEQNYVGGAGMGVVSLVTPKPGDTHALMDDWYKLYLHIISSDIPTTVKLAVISSQFIYIHPFMDGNGRVSRYLIQDVIARSGLMPTGVILPISAGILDRKKDYYDVLDLLSRNITNLCEYSLDDRGALTVFNNTAYLYQHLDLTSITEFLAEVMLRVVNNLLPTEIGMVQLADTLMAALDDELEMPAKNLRLLVRLILNNHGRLSKTKKKSHFDLLTDEEVTIIDRVCQEIIPDGI